MGSRAGYITVDWDKLDKDMKEAQNNVHKKLSGRQNRRATKNFMKQVIFLFNSSILLLSIYLSWDCNMIANSGTIVGQ